MWEGSGRDTERKNRMIYWKKITSGLLAAVMFASAVPLYTNAEETAGKNTAATIKAVTEADTAADTGEAVQKNIVVVIDPGHGGSNTGGQIPGLDEKNATLITAMAMKEELEKYKGITVYLTRYGDDELSLSQRPQLAADVGADFFFSLHYNKAVPNRLYGAEVWIPSLGENYSKGYACGDLILNELCDGYGLYRRGIKTKLNKTGTDYYGVIKNATALGIPSMIIEHCHIDNEVDIPYFNSIEKLQLLGRLDATGVAKYFRLQSDVLGVDYSNVQQTVVAAPVIPIGQDETPPQVAAVVAASQADGQINAVLQGVDAQSGIFYYDYSLDRGITWSALQKWDSVSPSYAVTIPGNSDTLTVRIYNQYDLSTQSATVMVN